MPLKQKCIETSLGALTVSALSLSQVAQLDQLFKDAEGKDGVHKMLVFTPIILASMSKAHPEMTLEKLEGGLSLEDFNGAFDAVIEVSGLKKTAVSKGEAIAPVQ